MHRRTEDTWPISPARNESGRVNSSSLILLLDDRAHHETLVNQCNVSPITGFARHTKLRIKEKATTFIQAQ